MKTTSQKPSSDELTKAFEKEIAFLRSLSMFAGVSEQELAHLCQVAFLRFFPTGAVLLDRGQRNDTLYLIREGRVGLFHQAQDAHAFLELERGSFFGQVSMFDPAPSSATVRARTDVKVMGLRAQALGDLVVGHPGTGMRLLMAIIQDLAKRYRTLLRKIESPAPPVFDCDRHT
jgi:CRP-like cAMP-binding protein